MDNKPKDKMGKRDNYLRGVFPFISDIDCGLNSILPLHSDLIHEVRWFIEQNSCSHKELLQSLEKIKTWKESSSSTKQSKTYQFVLDKIFGYYASSYVVSISEVRDSIFEPHRHRKPKVSREETAFLYALLVLEMINSYYQNQEEENDLIGKEWEDWKDNLFNNQNNLKTLIEKAFSEYKNYAPLGTTQELFGSKTLQERSAKANDKKNEHMRQVVAIIEKYILLNYASLSELFPPPRNGQGINFTEFAKHIFWEELTQDLRIEFTPFYKLTKKPENKNFKKKDFMDIIKDHKKVYGTPFAPYKTIARKAREVLYTIEEKSTKF